MRKLAKYAEVALESSTLPEADKTEIRDVLQADPYAFYNEPPPETVSIVWDLQYTWGDQEWMTKRGSRNSPDAPISIYEAHLGSWMRKVDQDNRSLTYRELAVELAAYVKEMGYTHVQFLPIMEFKVYKRTKGIDGYYLYGCFAARDAKSLTIETEHLIFNYAFTYLTYTIKQD